MRLVFVVYEDGSEEKFGTVDGWTFNFPCPDDRWLLVPRSDGGASLVSLVGARSVVVYDEPETELMDVHVVSRTFC